MHGGTIADLQQRMIDEAATAVRAMTVAIGIRLGLYQAMSGASWLSPADLAARTDTDEVYVREWLHAQVSGGYVQHDKVNDAYLLTDDYAVVLADPSSPMFGAGFFPVLQYLYATEDRLVDAFRTGRGVAWSERGPGFDRSLGRFFLPGYRANLVENWLSALDGVTGHLRAGARVADVGCGEGHSTLIMAEAFPESTFVGFDYSAAPIEHAKALAAERGQSDRVDFQIATAESYPDGPYDLITMFNCLHDLGNPEAAARKILKSLAPGGTWMLVEPNAAAELAGNEHPAGRLFLSLSVVMCLPVAVADEGPHALGNHAGEAALRDIAVAAGFTRWRRAAESRVSAVYEIQP
jgi:2-polyprenyl-3-methyl-5-hydroxy-6-metoxy-1,4-benzoquinol methylase